MHVVLSSSAAVRLDAARRFVLDASPDTEYPDRRSLARGRRRLRADNCPGATSDVRHAPPQPDSARGSPRRAAAGARSPGPDNGARRAGRGGSGALRCDEGRASGGAVVLCAGSPFAGIPPRAGANPRGGVARDGAGRGRSAGRRRRRRSRDAAGTIRRAVPGRIGCGSGAVSRRRHPCGGRTHEPLRGLPLAADRRADCQCKRARVRGRARRARGHGARDDAGGRRCLPGRAREYGEARGRRWSERWGRSGSPPPRSRAPLSVFTGGSATGRSPSRGRDVLGARRGA